EPYRRRLQWPSAACLFCDQCERGKTNPYPAWKGKTGGIARRRDESVQPLQSAFCGYKREFALLHDILGFLRPPFFGQSSDFEKVIHKKAQEGSLCGYFFVFGMPRSPLPRTFFMTSLWARCCSSLRRVSVRWASSMRNRSAVESISSNFCLSSDSISR